MQPPSSSTSNSDAAGGGLRETLVVAAWFTLFLIGADFTVNRLFPLPRDPRAKRGNRLVEYFNYGLSIEAKIRRAIGPTDATTGQLMHAGWIGDQIARAHKEPAAPPNSLLVSFYGMSFSDDIARTMAELDPSVRLRLFDGPGAPPNHSYALYSADRGGNSQVVVLGILGSSVPGLLTNNGMTWRFEGPAPFTYPRYRQSDGGLVAQWPMVRSLDDLRHRLADPSEWSAYLTQLRATDAFYNTLLFRSDLGDKSTIVRMIRRAIAQRWQASRIAQIHGRDGFIEPSETVSTLRAIVSRFALQARRDGKIPVTLLIQDQGYRDHVYKALEPALSRDRIAYVSTHTLAPDTDRRNFVADGHFTVEAYRRVAAALLETIRRELSNR